VYFLGPWRLLTVAMLRQAIRRDLLSLRVRVAHSWASVPLATIRVLYTVARPSLRLLRAVIWAGRRSVAHCVIWLRPSAINLAFRLAGPADLAGTPLQFALAHSLKADPHSDAVAKRVVHVCGSLQPGGAERQLTYTLKGLAQENLESVQLLCHNLTRGSGQRYDFYLPALLKANVVAREIRRWTTSADTAKRSALLGTLTAFLPASVATDVSNLFWEFVELKPEVVHAWLDWDNVRAGLAAVLAGVPKVILSCRNINPSHFSFYQPYMDPAYRALAQVPTVTFVNNSQAGADDYAKWIGIPRTRIRVIYNGVDFGARGRLSADAVADLRRSLGIPPDAFVVGGVFRLEDEKRPILWIETAARVSRQVGNAWFVIFGQGRMHGQIRRKARQLGLRDRFILAGVTDEVLDAMSIMDLLLLTSRGEGLPNVLLEAQWVGTPVITTDAGGAKEAIDPGATGWIVASGKAKDLARQITWLHQNRRILDEARDRGPAFVREQFGVACMISQTLRAYGH
jgi:glycosyltransferase involved in cell wall biosynthesis